MLRVRMLGALSAEHDGQPVRFSTRKSAALLALLAFRPGQAVARVRLAATLWPESGESAARTSLRQGLSTLRRDLGDGSGSLIQADADTVCMPIETVDCDAAGLEAALASAEGMMEVAALYGGEFLAGFDAGAEPFEAWRRREAARLHDRVTGALTAGLAAAARERDILAIGNALLTLDPAAEEAHQALMRAHLARGALGSAMRQYQRCREALARELDVPPSPETEALRRRIRAPRPDRGETHPSVAVLPFTNLSDALEQAWFARAFAEDLTAELSRFRVLHVIAASSVFALHDSGASPQETADRLGVRYLLGGSVRRSGEQVRLVADLTDAVEARHLWSHRFELPPERLQAAADDIVTTVAATLAKQLEQHAVQVARGKPAGDLHAWECWLHGLSLLRTGAPEHQGEAEALFTRALALDPGFARAEAGLSLAHFNEWSCLAWDRWDQRERGAYHHATRAVTLDPADPVAHFILGRVLLYRREFAKAEHHLERAETLNPNDADMQTQMALAHCVLGRPERGRQAAELAVRLNPFHDDWYFAYAAMPEFCLGDYEAALALGERAPIVATDMDAYRAAAAAHLGRTAEAEVSLDRFLQRFRERITFGRTPEPDEPAHWLVRVNPFVRPQDIRRLLEGVRRAGLPVPDRLTSLPSFTPRAGGAHPLGE